MRETKISHANFPRRRRGPLIDDVEDVGDWIDASRCSGSDLGMRLPIGRPLPAEAPLMNRALAASTFLAPSDLPPVDESRGCVRIFAL